MVTGNCDFYIKRVIPPTDVIQLTSTLKMTTAQVVETSVTVIKSPNFRTCIHTYITFIKLSNRCSAY